MEQQKWSNKGGATKVEQQRLSNKGGATKVEQRRNLGLDGKVEGSLLERQQGAIHVSCALRVNEHIHLVVV